MENRMYCYVCHPKSGAKLPLDKLNHDNTLFYPEKTMSTYDQCTSGRPSDYHIVTDSVYLVGLYSREEVFIWDGKRWVHPNIQTYGSSFDNILFNVFNYTQGICGAVISRNLVTNVMGHQIKT